MTSSTQLDSSKSRYDHLKTLFDQSILDRITSCSILVVGAGGIGCELLKNLVCTGFANITVVDLDTVDTSNLNRQFLFQKKHVKKPKATVARDTASAFNPNVTINALHANIMDPQFNHTYFKSFDLVLNALDNLAARRHVNKMCVMTKVPLVESGTAGYNGQVQPIRAGEMECYDCHPKPLPKTYPVCTIRSTPSTPIHCVVWAKSYLFPQLFGPEDENEGADLDVAVENGESVQEVENLRAELKRMKQIRAQLDSPEMTKIAFTKVFGEDIKRLLMMEDMWQHRTAPIPLNYDEMMTSQNNQIQNGDKKNNCTSSGTGLKDQQTLSLKDSFDLFCSSLIVLGKRIQSDPTHEPLRWDKDDDDALDFVTAAANLRANVFGIPHKTRFEVKEMAGNIIPAIATTNSAVSALIVFQAINILTQLNEKNGTTKNGDTEEQQKHNSIPKITACRPWYNKSAERIIVAGSIDAPNPHCEVCQVVYSTIHIKDDCTLKEFMDHALKGKLYTDELDEESVTIQEGDRLLFDPDFTDNKLKTFTELKLLNPHLHRVLRVTDEDEKFVPIFFIISDTPPPGDKRVTIDGLPETLPNRPPPPPTIDPTNENYSLSDIEPISNNHVTNYPSNGNKRDHENNCDAKAVDQDLILIRDDLQLQPPYKKIKLDHSTPTPVQVLD